MRALSKTPLPIVAFLLLFKSNFAAASAPLNTVKKSSSGLCHGPTSPYYERTKKYEGFDSIEECLKSGGRVLDSQRSDRLHKSVDYERSKFGAGWDDSDRDCQNQRAEALIKTSSTSVRFADKEKCRVITGRWISPFTGNVIQNASNIDIDHVVPLSWAWNHGASNWSQDRREQFANDLVNLWPVEASLNRSKGDSGPDDWLPPEGKCQYLARFLRITKKYDLRISEAEIQSFKKILGECR